MIVPHDLGNPLILEKEMPSDPFAPALTRKLTQLEAIHRATPQAFFGSLIRVYCCWDVGDLGKDPKTLLGNTGGNSSFVEDGTNEFVFAHELGHALGLRDYHNTKSDKHLGWGLIQIHAIMMAARARPER